MVPPSNDADLLESSSLDRSFDDWDLSDQEVKMETPMTDTENSASSPAFEITGSSTDQNGDGPYSKLIYDALRNAPGNQMVLQELYDWFEKHTNKPMRTRLQGSENGWKNSIRHNLSMNQAFEKITPPPPQKENGRIKYIWRLTNDAMVKGFVESTTRFRNAAKEESAPSVSRRPPSTAPGRINKHRSRGKRSQGGTKVKNERIARVISSQCRYSAPSLDHSSLQPTSPPGDDRNASRIPHRGIFAYSYDGMHTPASTTSTGAESHVLDPPVPGDVYDSQVKLEPYDTSAMWAGSGLYDYVYRDLSSSKLTQAGESLSHWNALAQTAFASPRSVADTRTEALRTSTQPATCSMADLRLTAGTQEEPTSFSSQFGSYGDLFH